ncbi:ADP-heptose--LPS heptosyltransferase I [Oceanisphaera profunda]|uniref:ADP-heptose--LPS heptosyltransferase I n=1 Tax=Oceanisphaera profunda TaxID=1416627 RepID=A0A1Y0D480_9GAMM|nr:glycosyltransferase family 9 protein [Oceanisphaera profunda]ART82340.1 ADP-heptose--LPS heptosyltransferase I [Oceanisphaera profunda]
MALFDSPPISLCLLRLSAIGDCCHAIALVQAIQRQWPTTKITWITGKVEANLLQLLPNVEIIVFDKSAGWHAYRQLWRTLKGREFDALLHMQAALRASIASLGIRAKYRLGFDKSRAKDGQWLFTNYKVAPHGEHVVDGFMAFGQALGLTEVTPHWSLDLPDAAVLWAKPYQTQQPLLLICPAASKAYKNWTAEGYAKLAEYAHHQGMKVMLIGSPAQQERELAAQICALTPHIAENLVGKTSLPQLLALIKVARLVVAPDTGPTHMATLVGTPVLGLYAHHNPSRTGPYYCRDYVVSVYEQALLAETSKTADQLPWRTRVKDKNAMQSINIEQVTAQFERIIHDFNLLQEPV